METKTDYAFKKTVPMSVDGAESMVRAALAAEGFGVLTEIDFRQTMRDKLDVDFRPYRILGACNPPFAHQAVASDLDIGLLLPCNVLVYEGDDPGTAVVVAIDPARQLAISGRDDLDELAGEVRDRLRRVIDAVG
jgi:uncharacterized protein (DUF302 family)